jgi:phosphonate transport system substrate-binding protein
MKAIIFMLTLLILHLSASDTLVFGAISTVEAELMKTKLTPLINYIQNKTGKTIEFQTGYNYSDTIAKFATGEFDIGYIGPSPYIKAKKINPDSLNIIAKLKNSAKSSFESVIISKKGSSISKLDDLIDKRFAFGSPNSTLSHYVPMDMLIKKQLVHKLKCYDFLGRHDRVAQYVIMGRYDTGAIKKSIAQKYSKYLQVVATSRTFPDFMIVANPKIGKEVLDKLENAILGLKDRDILKSLKDSAIGFEKAKDSDYDELRIIMKNVDEFEKRTH